MTATRTVAGVTMLATVLTVMMLMTATTAQAQAYRVTVEAKKWVNGELLAGGGTAGILAENGTCLTEWEYDSTMNPTLIATPASGYTFAEWRVSDSDSSPDADLESTTSATTKIDGVSADATITAVFYESANSENCVSVPTWGGTVIRDATDASKVYVYPAEGYMVNRVEWFSADPNGSGSLTNGETLTAITPAGEEPYYSAEGGYIYAYFDEAPKVTLTVLRMSMNESFDVNMYVTSTVSMLQNQIATATQTEANPTGVAVENQWLVFGDTHLADGSKTLMNYQITKDGSIVKLYETTATSGYCGVATANGGANVKWTLTEITGETVNVGTTQNPDMKQAYRVEITKNTSEAGANCAMADYTIKKDAPWLKIGDESTYEQIKETVIGAGVTSVGNHAFYSCSNLVNLSLGVDVTSIIDYAFKSCRSLTDIDLPDGLTSIGRGAFDSCHDLTAVSIPDGVTSIDEIAFNYCKALKSVTVGNGVTKILSGTFGNCDALESVTIGSGVKTIDKDAFYGNKNIKTVCVKRYAPDTDYPITALAGGVFSSDNLENIYVPKGALDAYQTADNWKVYASKMSESVDPDAPLTVTVEAKQWVNGELLAGGGTAGILAENGTCLTEWEYDSTMNPTLIATPASGYRFVEWRVSDSEQEDPNHPDADLESTTSATTTINSVHTDATITAVFQTNSVNCESVPTGGGVVIRDANKVYVYPADGYTVSNVTWFSGDPHGSESVTSQTLDVTPEGGEPYYSAPTGGYICAEFNNPPTVTLTVRRMATNESISVSMSVSSTVSMLQNQITTATQTEANPTGVAVENQWLVFGDKHPAYGSATLYYYNITDGSIVKLYETTATSGYCGVATANGGANVKWTLTEITGETVNVGTDQEPDMKQAYRVEITKNTSEEGVNCAMADYANKDDVPWLKIGGVSTYMQIKEAVIGAGVTSVGNTAFYKCKNLDNLSIGGDVTSIGKLAFEICTGLTVVSIPDGVTSIGMQAFGNCDGLKSVTVGDGVTEIYKTTFHGCKALESVTIGSGVKTIASDAFSGSNNIKTVCVKRYDSNTDTNGGSPITALGGSKVFNSNKLENIYVPEGALNAYQNAKNWKEYASKMSESVDPDAETIGYISYDASATQGVTLKFYRSTDQFEKGAEIAITDGKSAAIPIVDPDDDTKNLYAVKDAGNNVIGYRIFFALTTDGLHYAPTSTAEIAAAITVETTTDSGSESIDLSYDNDLYYFTMPADGNKNVTVSVGTIPSVQTLDGSVGYPHIDYIDADGNVVNTADLKDGDDNAVPVYVLAPNMTVLGVSGKTTWYYCPNNLNYANGLTLDGDVNIILGDDYEMKVSKSFGSEGKTITLLTQSAATGQLSAYQYVGSLKIPNRYFVISDKDLMGIRDGSSTTAITGTDLTPLGNQYIRPFAGRIVRQAGRSSGIFVLDPDPVNDNCRHADLAIGNNPSDSDKYYIYQAGETVTLDCGSDHVPVGTSNAWNIKRLTFRSNSANGSFGAALANTYDYIDSDGNLRNQDGRFATFIVPTDADVDVSLSPLPNPFTLPGGYCGKDNAETTNVDEGKNLVWTVTDEGTGDVKVRTLTIKKNPDISGQTDFSMADYSNNDASESGNFAPWILPNDAGNSSAGLRYGIVTATIADGVTSVGAYAFDGCSGLTSVSIASSIVAIGERAFQCCTGLTSVSIPTTTAPTLGDGAFNDCSALALIFVPDETAYDDYISDNNWSDYANKLAPATVSVNVAQSGIVGGSGWATYCHSWPVAYSVGGGTGFAAHTIHGISTTDGNASVTLGTPSITIGSGNSAVTTPNVIAPYTPVLLSYPEKEFSVTLTAVPETAVQMTMENSDSKHFGAWGGYLEAAYSSGLTCGYDAPVDGNGKVAYIFYGNPAHKNYGDGYTLPASSLGDYINANGGDYSYVLRGGQFVLVDGANDGVKAHKCWLNVSKSVIDGTTNPFSLNIIPDGGSTGNGYVTVVQPDKGGTISCSTDKNQWYTGNVIVNDLTVYIKALPEPNYIVGDITATVTSSTGTAEARSFGSPAATRNGISATANPGIGQTLEVTQALDESNEPIENIFQFTLPNGYENPYNVTVTATFTFVPFCTVIQDESGCSAKIGEGTGSAGVIDNSYLDENGKVTLASLEYCRELSAPTAERQDQTIDNNPAMLYTTCLPTTPPTDENVKYFTLSSVSDKTLKFTEISGDPQADTPYLVAVMSSSTESSFTESVMSVKENDVTLKKIVKTDPVDGYTMMGTQTGLENADAIAAAKTEGANEDFVTYILQPEGKWGKVVSGSVFIPTFRAFIVGPDVTNNGNARELTSSFDDDATGIQNILTVDRDGTERWYDLNGRRIAPPTKKGIYINNGKKVIKK